MSTITTRRLDAPAGDGTPAPLHNEQLEDERLGKPTALAVSASDHLSSSAYATEEILRVLVPAIGIAAFALVVPITPAMLIVNMVVLLGLGLGRTLFGNLPLAEHGQEAWSASGARAVGCSWERPPWTASSRTTAAPLSLVFLGRSEIPGIEVGSRVRAEDVAGQHRGRVASLNPVYQLLTTG
jgi:hypothetical protein